MPIHVAYSFTYIRIPPDPSPRAPTIPSRRVIWISASQPEAALGLRYQQIVMHAISRDTSSFPRPCIYLQLDSGSEDMRQQEGGEDGEEEEEEAPVEAEIRLVPEDAAKGEQLGEGFGACVLLCLGALVRLWCLVGRMTSGNGQQWAARGGLGRTE